MVCEQAIKKETAPESRHYPRHRAGVRKRRLECGAPYGKADIKSSASLEVGGGLYNKNGMDVEALWEFRQRNTVHSFPARKSTIPLNFYWSIATF